MGYLRDDGYQNFVRPSGDAVSIAIVRERTDVGAMRRFRAIGSARELPDALGNVEKCSTTNRPIIITDSGFTNSTDGTIKNRYTASDATRVGVVAGIRAAIPRIACSSRRARVIPAGATSWARTNGVVPQAK